MRKTNVKRGDLIDPGLFGNEAGEDEDPQVLASYFVEKPEFVPFQSAKYAFRIVKSKKGVGKSALLARTCDATKQSGNETIVLYLKGADLAAVQKADDISPNGLINMWQQRLCSRINAEIGKSLNWAFKDASITLVESAELNGLKDRNLVSSLFDRLKFKASPIERERLKETSSKALLERYAIEKNPAVWLFIDDIDATFLNTHEHRLSLSTFFTVCRYLTQSVRGLVIRASVRTDVWTILAQHDEALDKCEQYLLDLHWSNLEAEQILVRKILSYFQRTYPNDTRYKSLDAKSNSHLIQRIVFAPNFRWGQRLVSPDRPIFILSNGRPRWAAHLCKLSGKLAYKFGDNIIAIRHVSESLLKYGEIRLGDLYKEHRHQCKDLNRIIECFARGDTKYTTQNLMRHLTERVIRQHGVPEIDGIRRSGGALDVAHFLYRIGFICGRDQHESGGLTFVRYEDRPNLLTTSQNLDDGLIWEVHPSYRAVLRIS